MKLRLIAIMTLIMMALVACQNADDNDATRNNPDGNVEPTRYQDQNIGDDNRQRDHVMERDVDRNADRDMNYDVSKEAAERITEEMDDIDRAYVLTTDNTAYVGANLDTKGNQEASESGAELTDDVKDKIADIVRSVDSSIDNVYVTTNPDFMDLADRYANDMEAGNPVEGFFNQIGNMIDRVFPDGR